MKTRRLRLRPGMTVWLWYAGVVSRATLVRRGLYVLRKHWRLTIYAGGQTHYAARGQIHLCREDAANAL